MTVVAATPGLPEKRALFPDQAEAVSRVARHLRRPGTRGLYVAATGTGKTLVSARVADELKARLVLFVVPTLDLAAQTALAWRSYGHTEHMVIVSSMDAAGRDNLVAARVMSSKDPVTLAALMSVVGEREDQIPALTLICTYDSLDKIQETRNTAYTVPPFDLAVMDEAHRIAGRPDKKWAAVHDNLRIRADRRLYMTATPRIFAAPDLAESADTTRPRRHTPTAPGPAADLFANSMNNEQVYGKKIFEYPLAKAIEEPAAPLRPAGAEASGEPAPAAWCLDTTVTYESAWTPSPGRPLLWTDAHPAPGRTAPRMDRGGPSRRPTQLAHLHQRPRTRPRSRHRRPDFALELRHRGRPRQPHQNDQAADVRTRWLQVPAKAGTACLLTSLSVASARIPRRPREERYGHLGHRPLRQRHRRRLRR